MKKFLLAALLSVATLSAFANKAVVFHYSDGTQANVFLSENPVITVNATTVMVRGDETSLDIPFTNLSYYDVQDLDPTSVESVPVNGFSVTRSGNIVTVKGAKQSALFSVNGITIASGAGDQTYDLSAYDSPAYILRVDNKSYKFAK